MFVQHTDSTPQWYSGALAAPTPHEMGMTTECRRIGERGRLCRTVVISDPHMRLILPLSSKHATVPSMQLLTKVKCHCADLIWRLGGLFEYCFMVFWVSFMVFGSVGAQVSRSVSQSVGQSVSQPSGQSVSQSVSQSVVQRQR